MELEQVREKWLSIKPPTYSREELESIYHIKQANILRRFKVSLGKDLALAVIIAAGFIAALQILNLRTSNFWSAVMAFLIFQHLISYLLQSFYIKKYSGFSGNVTEAIETSVKRLRKLLWHYRVWPVLLAISLFFTYLAMFGIPLSPLEISLTLILTTATVLLISEFLSTRIVKSRILQLKKLKKDLAP